MLDLLTEKKKRLIVRLKLSKKKKTIFVLKIALRQDQIKIEVEMDILQFIQPVRKSPLRR